MKYTIRTVEALPDFKLLVDFNNDVQKIYDVSKLFLKNAIFEPLKNFPALFNAIHLAPKGYAVEWNDDIDIAADELYINGEELQNA
ncbi:hypothetical protein FACS1894125_1600 [Actinomycetota bacterium]|nr:hypothetical protein FACS1894125_1600 [Actinomycetota bacterium]